MKIAFVLGVLALASVARADPPHLRAEALTSGEHIAIDGTLDEAAWARAAVGGSFIERVPTPGDPAPVDTTVRVLFDDGALYFGIDAELEPGETPRALELTRDSGAIFEDDAISLKIDARRDGRTTLGFVVNAAGTQLDYLAIENGASVRFEHDMVWESASVVAGARWTIEVRIPVAALGLSASREARSLGLNVTRDHNARAATYDWAPMRPEFGPWSALHYGVLDGVETGGGVPAALSIYSLGEYIFDGDAHTFRGAIGADAWVRLAADTWLEGTAFTDFSQVDLDDAAVNLDRFPLFFPERRPFFLNGLDVFAAGVAERLVPFYSRRIGLAADGTPLFVLGGVKLFGREGPVSFGILDVLTDDTADTPATNDVAGRVRVSLDGRASYVGALVASRLPFHWDLSPLSSGGPHVTYAGDARLRFADDRMEISGFAAGTARDGPPSDEDTGEGAAAAFEGRYRGEITQPYLTMLWAEHSFAPDLGYVRRPGAARMFIGLPFIARPGGDARSLELTLEGQVQTDDTLGHTLFVDGELRIETEFFDGWTFAAAAQYVEDTVVEDFEIVPGVLARQGTYHGAILEAWMSTPEHRNPTFSCFYAVNNAYFGGVLHNPYASFSANLGPYLRVSASADVYYAELRQYDPFWAWAVNALVRATPSNAVQIDLLGRLNGEEETAALLLRLRWRYAPGSDLFAVWQEDIGWAGGVVTSERSVTVKTTIRFDALL